MGVILGFILLCFLYFPKHSIWYLWMATPCTFSVQTHISFPLRNSLLSGSSHSVNAIYFPLDWEIREPGSPAVGCNAACCLPSRCDTTPQHPFGQARAYANSVNVNFLFALFAICLRLCFCKALHYLYSTKHIFNCDYTFLCILLWIPCMQSYLLSAIFSSLQRLVSLKRALYSQQPQLVLLLDISTPTRHLHCLLCYKHQLPGCVSLKYLCTVPEASK